MSTEKHLNEFLAALNGGRGALDAWLECRDEDECRDAIFGVIAAEREACAKLAEGKSIVLDGRAARRCSGGGGTWYEDSPCGRVRKSAAAAIRSRP